jgi:hypothetical protein
MARVRLNLPDGFPFSNGMEVRIGDINLAGHLSNDAVLPMPEAFRTRFANPSLLT